MIRRENYKKYVAIAMNNDLINNLDKLQTTDLGILRIKRNLSLDTPDVVDWCRQAVLSADGISRKGKNWYVRSDGCVITINAHSYTIITAHKTLKTYLNKKGDEYVYRVSIIHPAR